MSRPLRRALPGRGGGKRRRVLLVESTLTQRWMLTEQLKASSGTVEVTSTGSGREAVRLLEDRPFDVVVLGFARPRTDGQDTLRAIRSGPAADVPVIVLCAPDPEDVGARPFGDGDGDGADAYITTDMLAAPGGLGRFVEDLFEAHASS